MRTSTLLVIGLLSAACGGGSGDDDVAMPDAGPDAEPPAPTAMCDTTPAPPHLLFDPGLLDVERAWQDGDRIVAAGTGGWVVFGPTGTVLARGSAEAVAAGSGIVMVTDGQWVEMCSTLDGHGVGSIAIASIGVAAVDPRTWRPGIAEGGGYAWLPTPGGLAIVSTSGTLRFSVDDVPDGTAVRATASWLTFDAGGRLRHVDPANGSYSDSDGFAGRVAGWFDGDERFLTLDGATVHVYDGDAAELASFMPGFIASEASGHGALVTARAGDAVAFHRIGGGAAPIGTFTATPSSAFAHGPQGFAVAEPGADIALHVFGRDGTTLTHETGTIPTPRFGEPLLAPASAGWLVGDDTLALVTGDPATPVVSYLSYGRVEAIAAATTGQVAIATSAGVVTVDVGLGVPRLQDRAAASVAFSHDGLRLAIAETSTWIADGIAVRIETTDGAVVDTIPGAAGDSTTEIVDAAFTPDPGVLTLVRGSNFLRQRSLYRLADDTETAIGPGLDTGVAAFDLRPVVAPGLAIVALPELDTSGTSVVTRRTALYRATGEAIATVDGLPIGWLDADTLLVDTSTAAAFTITEVAADGTVGATVTLDAAAPGYAVAETEMQLLGDGRVLGPNLRVFDLASGAEIPFAEAPHVGATPPRTGAAIAARDLVFATWWDPVIAVPLP